VNDRLAFCDVCEEAYPESNVELHEHPKERAAERQFLGIEQKDRFQCSYCHRWLSEPTDEHQQKTHFHP